MKLPKIKSSLLKSAAKGSMWIGAGSVIEQLLRLIRNMIVARIIAPDVFALMAIILAVNQFFEAFNRLGTREAIIHSEYGDLTEYLNGAWFYSLGRSVLLYISAYFLAPLMSRLYSMPDLVPMMRVVFLCLIFRGLISPKAYVAQKDMKFRNWVFVEQLGGVVGIVTAIVLTIYIRNVWALVIGITTEALFRTILSFIFYPFIPRWKFESKYISQFLSYALSTFFIPFFTYIFSKADVFVIGKVLDEEMLGIYSMSLTFARIPTLALQKLLGPILTPTFSKIQKDKERLSATIIKFIHVFSLVGIPLCVYMFFFGEQMLSVIYSPIYASLPIPFAMAFTRIMLMSFNAANVAVLLAIGKPKILLLTTAFRAILVVALIYPATMTYGVAGASGVVLFSMATGYIIQVFTLKSAIGLSVVKYFSRMGIYLLSSVLIALTALFITRVGVQNNYTTIAISLIGLVGSVALSFFLIRGNLIKGQENAQ